MGEVIYGAGGHGRELAFQLAEQGREVVAHVDDFHHSHLEGGVPVLSYEGAIRKHPSATWHVAIGNIAVRGELLRRLRTAELLIGSFISARSIIAPSAIIGGSVQIFGNCVISAACRLGDDVIVNFGCVISHDVHIDVGSIVCPKVAVAGNVRIGRNVWLGVGCTISNGDPDKPLVIEDGAYVGAGACIISDVTKNTVVYGIPGKAIRER